MIITEIKDRSPIYPNVDDVEFKITRYYGEDALKITDNKKLSNLAKKYLYKDVEIFGEKGVVIGVEDNEAFADYYLIVYRPNEDKITFELTAELI